jgi:LysM repeat protein
MIGLGPEGPDREHTVQAGDTAAQVARELGVRVEDLGGLGDA